MTHHGITEKAQIISATLLAVAIGAVFYFNRPESSASIQSTDDAYVHADFTTAAPQVSGTVETVLVEDNQPVKKATSWQPSTTAISSLP